MPYYNRRRTAKDYPVIEITPAKILTAVIAVMVGFVLPAQIIDQLKFQINQPAVYTASQVENSGQVAGSSTVKIGNVVSQKYQEFMSSKEALTATGFIMIALAIAICVYLLVKLTAPTKKAKVIEEYQPIGLFD